MFIEQAPEARDEIGAEGRRDVEVVSGEPGEETVTNKSMAEMRRQHAQGAREGVRRQVIAQSDPASAQRAMRVHDAFWIAGGTGGEKDERVAVEMDL